MTFLLDGLHEDLNSISNKPYKEIEEKENSENDLTAAKRFWDFHKLRNNSVIVDLFHGQYKSTITCPDCHRISVTYDPFTAVGIPIPKLKKVDIYVAYAVNVIKTVKMSIYVSTEALFCDIGHYVNNKLETKISKFRCMIVCSNKCVKIPKPSDNMVDLSQLGFIFCCEISQNLLHGNSYSIEIKDKDEIKSFPRLINITKEMTFKDLKKYIYGFMRRYLDVSEEVTNTIKYSYDSFLIEYQEKKTLNLENLNKIIEDEFNLIFNKRSVLTQEQKEIITQNCLPYKLKIENEKTKEEILIFDFNSSNSISISEQFKNLNLKTKINEEDNISVLFDLLNKKENQLFLDIDFSKLINKQKSKLLNTCVNITAKDTKSSLTLNDCLEHFRLTERLGKNNEWYCKNCQRHIQAFKRLELFYAPQLLILQLKRFEYSSLGKYRTYSQKIDSVIDFPIDNLDLSEHIVGIGKEKAKYELYAVSQHFGSTGGGHYTAICKNNDKWFDFNDSSVSKTNESSIINSAAYLLFYRRKDNI